jgi:hypothetical protein
MFANLTLQAITQGVIITLKVKRHKWMQHNYDTLWAFEF